ncbi:MAG: ABC transporter permease [Dehalococcoidia bacterium]|nr:ABC transporter permease [Dehalococcoidia bacterium]
MRLIDISLNNLRRRKGRILFLALGIVMGVGTVVALISITIAMKADIEDKIDQFGANIVVTPDSDELALSYGGVAVASAAVDARELTMADAARIRTIPNKANIANVAPKLIGEVNVNGSQAMLVGVDFPSEFFLKKWWKLDGEDPAEPDQIIAGSAIARSLDLRPGGVVKIDGNAFKLAGVLQETGLQDDNAIFAEIGRTQRLLNKPDAVSFIEVSALCRACPIEDITHQIGDAIPGARVSALSFAIKSREATVSQLMSFSIALSVVVIIIGALIVFITMVSSVNERTREIGIFRSTGFRKTHVIRIILVEALIVSFGSGVMGWVIGMGGSWLLGPGIANLDTGVEFNPLLTAGAIGLSITIGLASSVYPALRASNLDPSEALRFI